MIESEDTMAALKRGVGSEQRFWAVKTGQGVFLEHTLAVRKKDCMECCIIEALQETRDDPIWIGDQFLKLERDLGYRCVPLKLVEVEE